MYLSDYSGSARVLEPLYGRVSDHELPYRKPRERTPSRPYHMCFTSSLVAAYPSLHPLPLYLLIGARFFRSSSPTYSLPPVHLRTASSLTHAHKVFWVTHLVQFTVSELPSARLPTYQLLFRLYSILGLQIVTRYLPRLVVSLVRRYSVSVAPLNVTTLGHFSSSASQYPVRYSSNR